LDNNQEDNTTEKAEKKVRVLIIHISWVDWAYIQVFYLWRHVHSRQRRHLYYGDQI
jgi:hypothetical protein